ncbi:hypothetical protein [Mariniflexile sp.]
MDSSIKLDSMAVLKIVFCPKTRMIQVITPVRMADAALSILKGCYKAIKI